MKVSCGSVDELIENLQTVKPGTLVSNAIYFSVSHRPIDNPDKNKSTKLQVVVQASCVVNFNDGTGYILECGEDCGFDRTTFGGKPEGSDRASELKRQLSAFCELWGKDTNLLPGIVSE